MKEKSKTIDMDANDLLFYIRHVIAELGVMSLEIESLMVNAIKVQQGEVEAVDDVIYHYENASEIDETLDDIISDFNECMIVLHKDIGKLLDKESNKIMEEHYFVKEEKSDEITDKRSLI